MTLQLADEWDKVFPKSDKVNHRKVSFKNHFGIEIAADLYEPKKKTINYPLLQFQVHTAPLKNSLLDFTLKP